MKVYMEERPRKNFFSKSEKRKIFKKAKKFVLKDLLPNSKINRIIIFGSLVRGTFGKYEKPFKHRLYSDVDFLILVENDFKIPKKWKPYFSCKLYDVFNRKKLDKKYEFNT
jgi:predicted nucleotidyltransferase